MNQLIKFGNFQDCCDYDASVDRYIILLLLYCIRGMGDTCDLHIVMEPSPSQVQCMTGRS